MWIFGAVLAVLFLFLTFTSTIIVISLFKKPRYDKYVPKVSILVPTYNESKNIEKCLKQIFASKYPKNSFEVIVVDDGSTDDTVKIVKKFAHVKILYARHNGKSEALNFGIKHCSNDIILMLDADTTLTPEALAKIVLPFQNEKVGATIGTYRIANNTNILTAFQNIEYSYNNLIRMGFSRVFNDSIWFYGAMSCYRKDALQKVGLIHSDTMTEDMDISVRLQNEGYSILHVYDAYSYTIVPDSLKGLFSQRIRWWAGVLQSLHKNRKKSFKTVFSKNKHNKNSVDTKKGKTVEKTLGLRISMFFVYISQWWWSIFAVLAYPMFIIQILYWLPYNLATFTDTFMYLFRWFSVFGPLYSVYMFKEWGISFFSIFGILSGLISVTFIIVSMTIFKNKVRVKDVLALIFYFPYTLLLNAIIMVGLVKYLFTKSKGFMR